jgi:hypothetical protein
MDAQLFLSYCRADRQLAEQFVRAATERGVTVWFDEKIEGGEDWRHSIVDALAKAKALVILFSEHSNASDQLIKELAVADNMRKRVIPVLVSDCEPTGAYLYELASRNWVSIHPNPETRLSLLVEHLTAQLDLLGTAPAVAAIAAPRVLTKPDDSTPAAAAEPLSTPRKSSSWSSLKRYDFYILVPILTVLLLVGLFSTGDNAQVGFGFMMFAGWLYSLFIAARDARSNRRISWRSFVVYSAVSCVGMISVVSTERSVTGFIGNLLVAALFGVLCAVVVCAFQIVLRRVFQLGEFRSKLRPLGG